MPDFASEHEVLEAAKEYANSVAFIRSDGERVCYSIKNTMRLREQLEFAALKYANIRDERELHV